MSRSFHRSSFALFAVLLLGLLLVTASAATADADSWTRGVEAYRAGDLDGAAAHIAQVVTDQPDWFGGHLMLGQVQLQQHRPGDALKSLTKAHELAPDDLSVRLALGQAALGSEAYSQAVSTLAGARPDGLDDARWLVWLRVRGEAAIGTGDDGAALRDFTTLLAKKDDADLRWKASILARSRGNAKAEIDHLRAGERIAEDDADRFLARRLTIRLDDALGKNGAAEQAACASHASDARRLAKTATDSEHLLVAGRLLACGGHDDATMVLTQAADAAPADTEAAYHLGRHHALSESFSQAEAVLAPLAEYPNLDPKRRTRVLDWLGYSIERQERFDEALTIYRRGNLSQRIAAAEKAKAIHIANLEAEAKAAKAQELINQINDIEGELEQGGLR